MLLLPIHLRKSFDTTEDPTVFLAGADWLEEHNGSKFHIVLLRLLHSFVNIIRNGKFFHSLYFYDHADTAPTFSISALNLLECIHRYEEYVRTKCDYHRRLLARILRIYKKIRPRLYNFPVPKVTVYIPIRKMWYSEVLLDTVLKTLKGIL